MNNAIIGQFIKNQRKSLNMTQQDLADKLGLTFQAVSKWENGDTLPDTTILLELSEILETSVDRLLNGGRIVSNRKHIAIRDIIDGFGTLEQMKSCFGEHSTFYLGAVNGINKTMNIDIEEYLEDEYKREVLYAEVIIQYILKGSCVNFDEVKEYIKSEKMRMLIKKYMDKTI